MKPVSRNWDKGTTARLVAVHYSLGFYFYSENKTKNSFRTVSGELGTFDLAFHICFPIGEFDTPSLVLQDGGYDNEARSGG
jgi:hypothetical protein